jgi:hypothetical protein
MTKSYADRRGTSCDAESNGRRRSCFLRHLRIVIAVALLGLTWPQRGARAEKVFPPIGDTGDVQEQQPDLCPAKNYLIGLSVRVGDWMDQLAIICGQLETDGVVTGHYVGPARGGMGGAAPVEVKCNANEIMTGVAFLFTPHNRQVRLLSFHCVSTQRNLVHDLAIGNQTHGPPSTTRQDCPEGEIINGLKVNYGEHVNAVGIACATTPRMVPPARLHL